MKISPISGHLDNVISVITNRKNSLLSFRSNLQMSNKYEMKAKKWIFWRLLAIFVHLFSVSLYAYAFCYSELNRQRFVQDHPERFSEDFQRREFLGKWKFLTRWNHFIQLIFFTLSLGFDLLSLIVPAHIQHEHSKKDSTYSVKHYYARCALTLDTLFHALVAPTAVVVTIMFWTLNFINPILVVSKLSVPEPFWLNHTVHSVVTIIVIIELFLTYHARPKILYSIILAFIFIISYVSLLFYVGLVKNYWAYGILNQLTNFQRILFISGILILYFSVFGILHLIHKMTWSNQRITSFILGFEPTQLSTKKIPTDQTVFSVPNLEQKM